MNLAKVHAGYSPDWWTPPEWLAWVHETLGGEFFDPCPRDWQHGDPSGLDVPWIGHVYVNHPGGRGQARRWWTKYRDERESVTGLVWCAFNVEQIRHMKPSPLKIPGSLVLPMDRIGFIWGGATGDRVHGEFCKSPAQWTVFWTDRAVVAPTPTPSLVLPTGR